MPMEISGATVADWSFRTANGKTEALRTPDLRNEVWLYQLELKNSKGDLVFTGSGVRTATGAFLPMVRLWGTSVVVGEGSWPSARPRAVELAGKKGSFPVVERKDKSPAADVGSVPPRPFANVAVESATDTPKRFLGCTVILADGQRIKAVALP